MDQMENSLFDIPDYDQIDDERFAAFPPPASPVGDDGEGPTANGMEDWDGNRESPKEEEPPKPARKTVKRNIPKLDSDRLTSERGLPALRTMFADTKFKGKGHEVEDLKLLLRRMEHWAHRLYPKLGFEDFISKLEALGNKKPVQTCLKRIRLDMPIVHDDFTSEGAAVLEGPSNGVTAPSDDFDMHLPSADSDPFQQFVNVSANSPPPSQANPFLSEETRLRIERNKQLALERRLAKLQSDMTPAPVPPLIEDKLKSTQEVEEFGEDMDAEFLDALVAAAAETEASVLDASSSTATTKVENCGTALASNNVLSVAASDEPSVADSVSKEGSETAVVKEPLETAQMEVEVTEMPDVKEPLDTYLSAAVADQDGDFATATSKRQRVEEGVASMTKISPASEFTINVETSADKGLTGPGEPATAFALETPTDDPSAVETSAGMLVSGATINRNAPEGAHLPENVTEAPPKTTDGAADKTISESCTAVGESAVTVARLKTSMEMNLPAEEISERPETEALTLNKDVTLQNPLASD